jgi:pilus assembly protein CpaB
LQAEKWQTFGSVNHPLTIAVETVPRPLAQIANRIRGFTMKIFRVLVLAVALIAGGGAAYLALNLQPAAGPDMAAAPAVPMTDVLVAASNIPPGASLSSTNIRWQAWPTEAINEAFISAKDQSDAIEVFTGTVVRSQFYDGEPIREGKLARAESGFMSAILPTGMRAVAVRVSAQTSAGGFILPNDRVDVILTSGQSGGGSKDDIISYALLQNIRVLAIDQTVEEQDGERVVVGKTATLELDPAQVDTITAAEKAGSLSLSLRSVEDADEIEISKRKRSGIVKVFRAGRTNIVKTQ